MKVLVTGGAGYVGSVLVAQLLSEGHSVRVLDNLIHGGAPLLNVWSDPHFEFILGDVRDVSAVKKSLSGIDAVVHLAAIVGDPACARNPEAARAINLDASVALFQEAERAGVHRFLFASTCSNYGKMKDSNQYVDEMSDLAPVSLYAETKVAVERLLLDGRFGQIIPTCLRFATVFGVSPRMRFDLTVNEFTMEALTKKHLVVFGEQFWRPYLHVRDVARATILILTAPPQKVRREVFNIGVDRQNYQKQQLVKLIEPYAPDTKVEYVHKDEDPRDYRVSFNKLRRAFDFHATRSVEDGIREVASLVGTGAIRDYHNPFYRN